MDTFCTLGHVTLSLYPPIRFITILLPVFSIECPGPFTKMPERCFHIEWANVKNRKNWTDLEDFCQSFENHVHLPRTDKLEVLFISQNCDGFCYSALADLRGHARCTPPPKGPDSFISTYNIFKT